MFLASFISLMKIQKACGEAMEAALYFCIIQNKFGRSSKLLELCIIGKR